MHLAQDHSSLEPSMFPTCQRHHARESLATALPAIVCTRWRCNGDDGVAEFGNEEGEEKLQTHILWGCNHKKWWFRQQYPANKRIELRNMDLSRSDWAVFKMVSHHFLVNIAIHWVVSPFWNDVRNWCCKMWVTMIMATRNNMILIIW